MHTLPRVLLEQQYRGEQNLEGVVSTLLVSSVLRTEGRDLSSVACFGSPSPQLQEPKIGLQFNVTL